MKTVDLIKAYMKDHPEQGWDTSRDKKQVKPKAVKPSIRKGK